MQGYIDNCRAHSSVLACISPTRQSWMLLTLKTECLHRMHNGTGFTIMKQELSGRDDTHLMRQNVANADVRVEP